MAVACTLLIGVSGCTGGVVAGAIVGTITGARAPTNEIQQIYYLGVFDPQDQLPPTIYRVRVHGQASAISSTKFASGWVRAELIDSLGAGPSFDQETGAVTFSETKELARLRTGRKLMLFGPEGFREAPADHRLVIVMGADPSAFFQAIDSVLGDISGAKAAQDMSGLKSQLLKALTELLKESRALERFKASRLSKESE